MYRRRVLLSSTYFMCTRDHPGSDGGTPAGKAGGLRSIRSLNKKESRLQTVAWGRQGEWQRMHYMKLQCMRAVGCCALHSPRSQYQHRCSTGSQRIRQTEDQSGLATALWAAQQKVPRLRYKRRSGTELGGDPRRGALPGEKVQEVQAAAMHD